MSHFKENKTTFFQVSFPFCSRCFHTFINAEEENHDGEKSSVKVVRPHITVMPAFVDIVSSAVAAEHSSLSDEPAEARGPQV